MRRMVGNTVVRYTLRSFTPTTAIGAITTATTTTLTATRATATRRRRHQRRQPTALTDSSTTTARRNSRTLRAAPFFPFQAGGAEPRRWYARPVV